jgi:chromosome segregation ATPase
MTSSQLSNNSAMISAQIAEKRARVDVLRAEHHELRATIALAEHATAEATANGQLVPDEASTSLRSARERREIVERAMALAEDQIGRLQQEIKAAEVVESKADAARLQDEAIAAAEEFDALARRLLTTKLGPSLERMAVAFTAARQALYRVERLRDGSNASLSTLDADPIPARLYPPLRASLVLSNAVRAFLQDLEKERSTQDSAA